MKWTVAGLAVVTGWMAWTAVCTVPASPDNATQSTLHFDFGEQGNVAPTDLYDADRVTASNQQALIRPPAFFRAAARREFPRHPASG